MTPRVIMDKQPVSGGGDGGQSTDKPQAKPSTSKFKPIGPKDLRKKYKFVEPPGLADWGLAFAKKCGLTMILYFMGYYQVSVHLDSSSTAVFTGGMRIENESFRFR